MNLDSWMQDTIIVSTPSSISPGGEPRYIQKREVSCRYEEKFQRVLNERGEEKLSKGYLACLEKIGTNDGVWLPDSNSNKPNEAKRPIAVRSARNKEGFRYYLVYF